MLSSGDAYIPGPFLSASDAVFDGSGRGDILIQNQLGFQAIALGNHEFDLGTGVRGRPVATGRRNGDIPGANFPYLSSNLDFAPDEDLAPLVTADGQEASDIPGQIAGNTVITVSGEEIGIVGATTPTLASIASPGDVGIRPPPPPPPDRIRLCQPRRYRRPRPGNSSLRGCPLGGESGDE